MPLEKGKSKEAFNSNVKTLMGEVGKSPHVQSKKQALAIAYATQRRGKAIGGGLSPKPLESIEGNALHAVRSENHPKGLIHSSTPGRTDRIPLNVAPHSYVIPADVVSGIGQGNTLAGAKLLHQAMPNIGAGKMQHFKSTIPKPPRPMGLAAGGVAPDQPQDGSVPIMTAGGEYVVSPLQAYLIGFGDFDAGHKKLDDMVVNVRKQVAKNMLKLPGPNR